MLRAMAPPTSIGIALLLLLLPPASSFFPGISPAHLALSGAASLQPNAISLDSPRSRVQLRDPVTLAAGFSTYFSFSFSFQTKPPGPGSLSFFLTPARSPHAPRLLAVLFDTTTASRLDLRIDLAGHTVAARATPILPSHTHLHSSILYNATSATLQVRLSATADRIPNSNSNHLLLSQSLHPLHLGSSPVLAGFASAAANCTLFTWAFHPNNTHSSIHSQPLDPSDLLTTPPPDRLRPEPPRYRYPWGAALSLLFAAVCGAMLTFFVLFVWYSLLGRHRPVAPVEYPMHPSDVVYEKIVLVGLKDDEPAADADADADADAAAAAGGKN